MDGQTTITTLGNGPLEVSGPVRIVDASGAVIAEGERFYLCRCGQSSKKPMCDGSHRRCGFTDGQDAADGAGKST